MSVPEIPSETIRFTRGKGRGHFCGKCGSYVMDIAAHLFRHHPGTDYLKEEPMTQSTDPTATVPPPTAADAVPNPNATTAPAPAPEAVPAAPPTAPAAPSPVAAPNPDDVIAEAEIVTDPGNAVATIDPQEVIAAFTKSGTLRVESPEEIQARLIAQRAQATTPEQLFNPQSVASMVDLAYQELLINGVHFQVSKYGGVLGYYAIIDVVVVLTGEVKVVASGSADVVVQLAKMQSWNMLPFKATLMPSNQGSEGRNPTYHLELVKEAPAPLS